MAWAASRPAWIARRRAEKSALPTPSSRGRITTSASRSSKVLMLRPMIEKVCISIRKASPGGSFSGGELMSTAITSWAPMSRAKRTGTGDTRPPSTYSRWPMRTGWNTAGTALEARTAVPVSPLRNRIAEPSDRSVATMPSGRAICSIALPAVLSRMKRASASPRINPRSGKDQSVIAPSSIVSASVCISLPLLPAAYSEATRLPAEVPATRSTLMPLSSNTWITPMWAKPRAAPPPSARPMRGGLGAGLMTGGGSTGGGLTTGGWGGCGG
mmetsp:Transcript_10639/g.43613  ORF Transcript_10639/g.43613 Transcript_10639/m.43613 type:complete len:271 (+) Transcript_10639:2648-3460(+)